MEDKSGLFLSAKSLHCQPGSIKQLQGKVRIFLKWEDLMHGMKTAFGKNHTYHSDVPYAPHARQVTHAIEPM